MGVPIYVSYEEAQRMIPVFEHFSKEAPWSEARQDSKALLREMGDVSDIDYSLLGGKQIFVTQRQKEFFQDLSGTLY